MCMEIKVLLFISMQYVISMLFISASFSLLKKIEIDLSDFNSEILKNAYHAILFTH